MADLSDPSQCSSSLRAVRPSRCLLERLRIWLGCHPDCGRTSLPADHAAPARPAPHSETQLEWLLCSHSRELAALVSADCGSAVSCQHRLAHEEEKASFYADAVSEP